MAFTHTLRVNTCCNFILLKLIRMPIKITGYKDSFLCFLVSEGGISRLVLSVFPGKYATLYVMAINVQ